MLKLKDFDCEGTYEDYLIELDKRKEFFPDVYELLEDEPERWRDGIGWWLFVKHNNIIHKNMTTEGRLLRIEQMLKEVLEGDR